MENEIQLPHLQKALIGPHLKPDESHPRPHNLFISDQIYYYLSN
jgi:hypothetical protein